MLPINPAPPVGCLLCSSVCNVRPLRVTREISSIDHVKKPVLLSWNSGVFRDFSMRNLFQSIFRLLASALRRMVYLESLDTSCALPLLVLLGTTPFSHLTQCSLPYSLHLIPFLRSHRSIRDLVIQPPTRFDLARLISDVFPYIILPNLDTYVGPSKVAQFVIPHSNAFHLTIFWDFDPPPEKVIPSFALSNKSVSVLDNIVVRWDKRLFTAIATFLPNVVMLRVRNASVLDDVQVGASCDVEGFGG